MLAWPALFGWGAGLLHIAIGAAVVSGTHDATTTWVLAGLVALGAVEIGWSTLWIVRERRRLSFAGIGLVVAAVALGGAAIGVGASSIAVGAGDLLTTVAASIAVFRFRVREPGRTAGSGRRPILDAIGLALGALLVAGIVTPAASLTDAGLHAVSHEHSPGDPSHHH